MSVSGHFKHKLINKILLFYKRFYIIIFTTTRAMRVSSEGIVEIFRDCNLNVIFNNFGLLFDGLDIDFKTEDVEQALRVAFEFASFIPDRPRPGM